MGQEDRCKAALERVRQASERVFESRLEFNRAIHDARLAGCTLSQLAEATGLSRQRISQIARGE